MYAKKIVLSNWMCYGGKHELNLEPKAYAVVARRKTDPSRSNWNGKSALAEAVYFALTGKLNPDRHMGADGWLTDGAKKGGVLMELSDGSVIERERSGSTKLHFTPRGGATALKDEAQKQLDQLIGLSADDIPVTSYFQQRKMARLILAKPEERMVIASSWFRLEKLENAEDHVASKVHAQAEKLRQLEMKANAHALRIKEQGDYEAHKKAVEQAEARIAEAEKNDGHRLVINEYRLARAEAAEVKLKLDADHVELIRQVADEAHARARATSEEMSLAAADLRQKEKLARGTFDGTCPVAGVQCPITVKINADGMRNAKLREEATKAFMEKQEKNHDAVVEERAAVAAEQEHDRLQARYDAASARERRLLPMFEEATNFLVKGEDVETLKALRQSKLEAKEQWQRSMWASKKAVETAETAIVDESFALRDMELLQAEMTVLREAQAIFGRNGAQRRLAESALEEISDDANAMMKDCGIDLSMEVRWAREAGKLATACHQCGAPFPASQKVKACSRCNAMRGAQVVNKMDILLSEQSGAAEDLSGASFQLAASNWLRADRNSPWSLALIDEPFGQLDARHRQAFSSHLSTMLASKYGFEQALVIAHDSSILDALPGRIQIENDEGRSVVWVAA